MKTFVSSMAVAFASTIITLFITSRETVAQRSQPTKLARYEIGSYISADSTKLRVSINKELGGYVYVHLVDLKGSILFEQIMMPLDTMVRLKLNLTELNEGSYTLKVSNGLDVMIRELKIIARKPAKMARSLTLVQQE